MNLRYISKYDKNKKQNNPNKKLTDLRSFAKKEIFSLTEKHLDIAVYSMKL